MKKLMMFLFTAAIISLSTSVNAQDGNDYFVGKWNILVEGTPSGDSNSTLILKKGEEGKLTGTFQSEGKEPAKLTRVEINPDDITCYFVASGYDVYIWLEKIDEDNMEGTMMDMFDCYATRKKEEK